MKNKLTVMAAAIAFVVSINVIMAVFGGAHKLPPPTNQLSSGIATNWPRITNGYADTNQQPRKLYTNMVTTNVFGYYTEDTNGFLTLHLGAPPVATPVDPEDTGVAPQPPTELKVDTSSSFWVVTNNTPIITDHSGVRLTRWLESPVTQFTETDIQIGLAPDGTVVWRERK